MMGSQQPQWGPQGGGGWASMSSMNGSNVNQSTNGNGQNDTWGYEAPNYAQPAPPQYTSSGFSGSKMPAQAQQSGGAAFAHGGAVRRFDDGGLAALAQNIQGNIANNWGANPAQTQDWTYQAPTGSEVATVNAQQPSGGSGQPGFSIALDTSAAPTTYVNPYADLYQAADNAQNDFTTLEDAINSGNTTLANDITQGNTELANDITSGTNQTVGAVEEGTSTIANDVNNVGTQVGQVGSQLNSGIAGLSTGVNNVANQVTQGTNTLATDIANNPATVNNNTYDTTNNAYNTTNNNTTNNDTTNNDTTNNNNSYVTTSNGSTLTDSSGNPVLTGTSSDTSTDTTGDSATSSDSTSTASLGVPSVTITPLTGVATDMDPVTYTYPDLGTNLNTETGPYYNGGFAPGDSAGGGDSCPAPWVKITLADGSQIEAKDIKVGMMVYTRHESKDVWGNYPVIAVKPGSDLRWKVDFEDGRQFVGTFTHPLHTEDRGWVELQHLKAGDKITEPGGTFAVVCSTKEDGIGEIIKITVEDAHTYLTEGFLSHNKAYSDVEEDAAGGLTGHHYYVGGIIDLLRNYYHG